MNKPFLNALNGKIGPKVPFWFMRQAGRYLPEYRELRSKQGGFLNMVYNPEAACEITMQPIRRFEMDAAILFSDILVIPHALGQNLEFVQGEGPKLNPIVTEDDFEKLSYDQFESILSPIYQTLKNVRNSLKSEGFNETSLIGFAGSPWTVSCYMVQGQGSKDFMKPKIMAYKNPKLFSKIINLLIESTYKYLIEQANSGAEALQLFESWSGVLDANEFEKWVIQPTLEIVKNIRKIHPNIPIIGFPKGAGYNSINYAKNTQISALGLDSLTSSKFAAEHLQTLMPVQGNLDPFCLFAGGNALENEAKKILENLAIGPFVFNLGHGIHKDTPIEHVENLVRIIKDWSL